MSSKSSSKKGSRSSTSSKNKVSSSRQKYVESDDEVDDEYIGKGISGTKSNQKSMMGQIPQPQIFLPDDWPVQKDDPFIQRGSSNSSNKHEMEFPPLAPCLFQGS